jgi:hypothetical protein
MGRTSPEVADIFQEYGDSYRQQSGKPIPHEQQRTLRAIKICRTAELGGHIDRCNHCGHEVISYNSCRNRHCPKCQSLAKAGWLEARQAELLSVDYFHVVFTLPSILNRIVLQNKSEVYDILFKAASQTLLKIAADPKYLGAKTGFMAILHTWGQNLLLHPHIHCVIPGGGLSRDEKEWIRCRKNFFLPVRVLSRLFRRLFLEFLTQSFDQNRLKFHEDISDPESFTHLIKRCSKTEWVVYAKPPFAGAEKVLDYLGRYTHRVAISNHRILKVEDGMVSFSWRNYRQGNKTQIMTSRAEEFIRRFLLHVLPSGFVRIRYFGFLSNRHRKEKLEHCRKLLSQPKPKSPLKSLDWKARYQSLTGKNIDLCPACAQGHLVLHQKFRPLRRLLSRPPPCGESRGCDFISHQMQL